MFDFVGKLQFRNVWQLHFNQGKCNTQSMSILQLVNDINIYDHTMYMHFFHPLDMTLSTC
jgi:hypothetical protein